MMPKEPIVCSLPSCRRIIEAAWPGWKVGSVTVCQHHACTRAREKLSRTIELFKPIAVELAFCLTLSARPIIVDEFTAQH